MTRVSLGEEEPRRNEAVAADRPRIVVVIPTFRRPDLLDRLIDSLADEVAAIGATVLVGDNDCDAAIRHRIERRGSHIHIHYMPVAERGVAQVRNALIDGAARIRPDWRWLVMLDDDGIASPGLLAAIVACGDRFSADLVGGPVEGDLPSGAGALARNSIFARRTRSPTGPVALLNTTQNLAIARRLLDRLDPPLFNARYGASGGEDYDLFRRLARANGSMVWCDEAVVTEPAPPERLTRRAILQRYYSTGIYMSPIDRRYDGTLRGVIVAAKGLVRGILDVGTGCLSLNADRAAQGVLRIAHHGGRVGGLIGSRSVRYVAPEASS